jgi:hypothetical protein
MHDFPTMDSNTKFAARLVLSPAPFVKLRHRGLHLHGGHGCILVVVWVTLGTSKHREDSVSDIFVNGSVASKQKRDRYGEIIIQHPDHIICIHFARQIREAADVRV